MESHLRLLNILIKRLVEVGGWSSWSYVILRLEIRLKRQLIQRQKVENINTQKRSMQYLYQDGGNAVFMDPKTFGQVEIPISIAKEELPYIKEGENADILFWDDKPLSIEISPKVTLTIKETAPGVKRQFRD